MGRSTLCGLEQLEMWLKTFPRVAALADIDPVDSPLIVSPDELADLVEAFVRSQPALVTALDTPPTPRVSYANKNALNKMSDEYAEALRKNYMKDTAQIQSFLAAPENDVLAPKYESLVAEFQLKIIAKRKDYQSFDEVLDHLMDLLFGRDTFLRGHKRLTRSMLFYMYWHCDIGVIQ